MNKNIHINTTLSNQDMDSKTRCGRIVIFMTSLFAKDGVTDRQIMEALEYRDMNCVRPRITELINKGILQENGSVRDAGTKRMVRLIRLTDKQFRLF